MPELNPFARIIAAYERGAITDGTLVFDLLKVTTPTNATELLRTLSPKLLRALEDAINDCPTDPMAWNNFRFVSGGTFNNPDSEQNDANSKVLTAFRSGVESVRSVLANRPSS